MKPIDFIRAATEAEKERCPECGCKGAHFCVGKQIEQRDFYEDFDGRVSDAQSG